MSDDPNGVGFISNSRGVSDVPTIATQVPTQPRRRSFWILALLLTFGVGFLAGSTADELAFAKDTSDPYSKLETFAQVLSQVERSYVEEVNQEDLINGAIKGMIQSLDPHSSFLTPSELKELRDRTAGQFVGVGIEVGVRDGAITVIAPLPGGSAEAAGVQTGDIIVSVNGASARSWTLQDAIKAIRGEEGTSVDLEFQRKGEAETLHLLLERKVVQVVSVESELLEPGYGMIAVKSFVRNVGQDVRTQYDTLVEANGGEALKGLILDLRNNPGGLLAEGVDLANIFLESGLIVSTEGRSGLELARHEAQGRSSYIDVPLVVLVNGGSASASGIVAGALQDHHRAVIVGARTFGKGSVQNIYDLEDGSGLKLTIARYFTPAHRSIQGQGITPDIEAADVELPKPAAEPDRTREADLPHALENHTTQAKPEAERKEITNLPTRTALDQLKAFRILSGKEL